MLSLPVPCSRQSERGQGRRLQGEATKDLIAEGYAGDAGMNWIYPRTVVISMAAVQGCYETTICAECCIGDPSR